MSFPCSTLARRQRWLMMSTEMGNVLSIFIPKIARRIFSLIPNSFFHRNSLRVSRKSLNRLELTLKAIDCSVIAKTNIKGPFFGEPITVFYQPIRKSNQTVNGKTDSFTFQFAEPSFLYESLSQVLAGISQKDVGS